MNPNVPGYEQALKDRNKDYEFVTYPDTQHAFFNDERPEPLYNPAAAADAWEKTIAFFRDKLSV